MKRKYPNLKIDARIDSIVVCLRTADILFKTNCRGKTVFRVYSKYNWVPLFTIDEYVDGSVIICKSRSSRPINIEYLKMEFLFDAKYDTLAEILVEYPEIIENGLGDKPLSFSRKNSNA